MRAKHVLFVSEKDTQRLPALMRRRSTVLLVATTLLVTVAVVGSLTGCGGTATTTTMAAVETTATTIPPTTTTTMAVTTTTTAETTTTLAGPREGDRETVDVHSMTIVGQGVDGLVYAAKVTFEDGSTAEVSVDLPKGGLVQVGPKGVVELRGGEWVLVEMLSE